MRKLHFTTSCGLLAALAIGFVAGALTGSSITSASAAGNASMPFIRPDRPAAIKVTPPPGTAPLTQLQQRVASLEDTLFGPASANGRPRPIQSNVIGQLQSEVQTAQNTIADSQNKEASQLAAIEDKLNQVLSATGQLNAASNASAATLQQVQQTLTDVQHRQAITCYGVFLDEASHFAAFQSQELEICGGRYYNPGVVTGYLNKMIPFKY
jgi:hypothetical protein